MSNIKLKLKKIKKRERVKRWCLSDLGSKRGQFQEALKKEWTKDTARSDGKIENKWVRLKEVIKEGAKKVFGYQKANTAKNHGSQT